VFANAFLVLAALPTGLQTSIRSHVTIQAMAQKVLRI
jgi:hypothetical protein